MVNNNSSPMNINSNGRRNTRRPMNVNMTNATNNMNYNYTGGNSDKKRKSVNTLPQPQLKRRNAARARPLPGSTSFRLDAYIPWTVVREFKNISLQSTRTQSEFTGIIPVRQLQGGPEIAFEPPTRETSGNRNTINTKVVNHGPIFNSYMSYHSHPGLLPLVENASCDFSGQKLFTLPSDKDLKIYIINYPRMQVNVILDRYGYYIVDFIESHNLSSNIKNIKNDIVKSYNSIINKSVFTNKSIDVKCPGSRTGCLRYYKSTIGEWKKLIDKEFKNVSGSKIRITFHSYCASDKAKITFLNKQFLGV